MRASWRASLALVLHFSFFAVPLGLVLGLLAIALYTVGYDRLGGVKAALAAMFVGGAFAVGWRALSRAQPDTRGVQLTSTDQPRLWQLVESAARAARTAVPDELRVTSEPQAHVREHTTLLGWRVRGRTVEIGLPLLAALTDDELRAVLTGELGRLHSSGKAGALPGKKRGVALADRITRSLRGTLCALTGGPVKWLFAGYVHAFTRLAPDSAELTFAGDAAAVRLLGRRVVGTALRKGVAIRLGWREYVDEYLSMASTAGHTPDVVLGFRSFMENQTRKPQLAERAKQEIADQPLMHDHGQPSVRERVAAVKRAPRPTDADPSDRPAFTTLRTPRESVPQLEDRLLSADLGKRVPWPELARMAGAENAARRAKMLASAVAQSGVPVAPTIAGVLAAVYHGQGRELINPGLNPGLDPERVDQAAVDTLTELLGATVVDSLVATQRAQHELDWAGPAKLQLPTGHPLDPDRLVRPAVEDPRLVPGLHRALVNLGVPLNHGREPAAQPDPVTRGVVSPVQCAGDGYDLVVTDRGLVLLPSQVSTAKRLLSGAAARLRRAEHAELVELASTEVARLRERTGAQWVDSRDIAAARLSSHRASWSLELDLYFDEYAVSVLDESRVSTGEEFGVLRLSCTTEVMEYDAPYRGLGELLGARMHVENAESTEEPTEPTEATGSSASGAT